MSFDDTCRAIFLDKDGTLVENVPYNVDPARVRLVPGAGAALRALAGLGFRLVVVSNQSGVARGFFEEEALAAVELRLHELLAPCAVELSGFYFCPHHPDGTVARYAIDCLCRKPAPGLLTRAAHDLGIDLRESWMIGDILNDVEAGIRAGCRTILVDNGNETEWVRGPHRQPHFSVPGLPEAVPTIVTEVNIERQSPPGCREGRT